MTYIWKNKHQDGYSIKERLDRYTRKQQGYSNAQIKPMGKKNNH